MTAAADPLAPDAAAGISELVERLHAIDERLEVLLGGEIDSVTNKAGRTTLLRRAQGHLRESEHVREAQALRASAVEFRSLAEAMPQIVWITAADGSNTYFNQRWMDYTGLSLQDSVGRGWIKPFHPDDKDAAVSAWDHAVRTRDNYSIECRLRSADGSYRWWLMRATPLLNPDGQVAKWYGTCTDVHDLKVAQLELARTNLDLKRSRAELRLVFDLVPAMIWFKDMNRNNVRVNQRAAKLIGRTVQEIEGQPTAVRFSADDARLKQEDDLAVMRSGAPRLGIIETVYDAEGNQVWVQTDKVPYRDENGEVIGIVVMAQDISERKRDQDALRELNAELEARVKARTAELDAFSYSVSHDLRSPLVTVDGFMTLLLREIEPVLNEKSRRYVSRILSGTRKMGELVDGLLTLAKASQAGLQRMQVDLSAMATEELTEAAEREPERRVQVEVTPGMTAHGDPRLLKQVFVNLIANAFKFTSARPDPRIQIGQHVRSNGTREFFVSDNGVGFDMARAGKLFGAFERLHSDSEFPGTGIGLATVFRIVSRHGGTVRARSAPGKGAAFLFTLPD
jgi:PAS domain S-box-containing protein